MAAGDSRIKLLRHAHVHYFHPDLKEADKFLADFGLISVERSETKIYYRGYGSDPFCYIAEQSPSGKKSFGGGAFIVDSRAELVKASKLPRASSIQKCDEPGGGECVILKDPNDMIVKLVYGQEQVEPLAHWPRSKHNSGQEKDRVGVFLRLEQGPSKVHKLGHYGFMLPKDRFKETRAWYLDNMNFMLTDSVYDPQTGEDETSFFHIDLVAVHHSSFEVHDMDSENLGHQWLQDHNWTNAWGVGRHLLGSQIFDYCGYIREAAARNSLYVWGPNLPKAFVTARVEDVTKVPALKSELVPE
ncbi:unnamed protein product [Sphagnum balticum]